MCGQGSIWGRQLNAVYTPPPDLDWKTYASDVAYRVKQLRGDLDLTQEALAERAGISRNQVQNIERGHGTGANGRVTNMSMEHVYRLAYALKVPRSCCCLTWRRMWSRAAGRPSIASRWRASCAGLSRSMSPGPAVCGW